MTNAKYLITVSALILVSITNIAAQTNSLSERSAKQVSLLIQKLDRDSAKFRISLNSALVQTRIDQTRSDNDISSFETGFEDAADQFGRKFIVRRAGAADVVNVLRLATLIDGFLSRHQLNKQVRSNWVAVKSDLNGLAKAYGLSWDWNQQAAQSNASNGSAQLSQVEIGKLIQRIETGGDKFRTTLTEAMGQQPYDRTLGESRLNDFVRSFKKDTDQLRIQFDDRRPIGPYVERLLSGAATIDSFLQGSFMNSPSMHDDWSNLRTDLTRLASAFNLVVGKRCCGTEVSTNDSRQAK